MTGAEDPVLGEPEPGDHGEAEEDIQDSFGSVVVAGDRDTVSPVRFLRCRVGQGSTNKGRSRSRTDRVGEDEEFVHSPW